MSFLTGSTVANGGNLLTLQGSGAGSIEDVIGNGAGGITKVGTGSWTLSGANTYSGATAVNAGTLLISNSSGSATGTGAVTVNNSGTLSGTGFINAGANNITVNGTLSPGAAAAAGDPGTINLAAGALTLASTSILMFDLGTLQDLVAIDVDRVDARWRHPRARSGRWLPLHQYLHAFQRGKRPDRHLRDGDRIRLGNYTAMFTQWRQLRHQLQPPHPGAGAEHVGRGSVGVARSRIHATAAVCAESSSRVGRVGPPPAAVI